MTRIIKGVWSGARKLFGDNRSTYVDQRTTLCRLLSLYLSEPVPYMDRIQNSFSWFWCNPLRTSTIHTGPEKLSITMSSSESILLYVLVAGVSIFILYRPFLTLITPKGIKGFPALPNPKPIAGDLFTITEGVQKTGGIFLFIDELAKELGPNFQLRMFNQTFISFCS